MATLVPCMQSAESISEAELPLADADGYCTHLACVEFHEEFAAYKATRTYRPYDADLSETVVGDPELLADEYHVR